jgi:hypothetical protein
MITTIGMRVRRKAKWGRKDAGDYMMKSLGVAVLIFLAGDPKAKPEVWG